MTAANYDNWKGEDSIFSFFIGITSKLQEFAHIFKHEVTACS